MKGMIEAWKVIEQLNLEHQHRRFTARGLTMHGFTKADGESALAALHSKGVFKKEFLVDCAEGHTICSVPEEDFKKNPHYANSRCQRSGCENEWIPDDEDTHNYVEEVYFLKEDFTKPDPPRLSLEELCAALHKSGATLEGVAKVLNEVDKSQRHMTLEERAEYMRVLKREFKPIKEVTTDHLSLIKEARDNALASTVETGISHDRIEYRKKLVVRLDKLIEELS